MKIQIFVEMPPDPCPACSEAIELARKLRRNYIVDLIDVELQKHNSDAKAWNQAANGRTPAIRVLKPDGVEWIRGKGEVLKFKKRMEANK